MPPQVWFITGCSQGLGLVPARAALQAEDELIAPSRNPDSTPCRISEIKALVGSWTTLDVTSNIMEEQARADLALYGRIDALANNVGMAVRSAVEEFSAPQVSATFAANFFGPP